MALVIGTGQNERSAQDCWSPVGSMKTTLFILRSNWDSDILLWANPHRPQSEAHVLTLLYLLRSLQVRTMALQKLALGETTPGAMDQLMDWTGPDQLPMAAQWSLDDD